MFRKAVVCLLVVMVVSFIINSRLRAYDDLHSRISSTAGSKLIADTSSLSPETRDKLLKIDLTLMFLLAALALPGLVRRTHRVPMRVLRPLYISPVTPDRWFRPPPIF